jgi:hypothetical protein
MYLASWKHRRVTQRRVRRRFASPNSHVHRGVGCHDQMRGRVLPKFRPVTPKLAPRFTRGTADKDVGVIPAFFIDDAPRVTGVTREATISEEFIGALT